MLADAWDMNRNRLKGATLAIKAMEGGSSEGRVTRALNVLIAT
jgi:hypothetical protein